MDAFDREPDEDLVEKFLLSEGRDSHPFEALMRRHQGFVAANCRAITRAPADVNDLAQEVFVKAFFGLRRFEGRAAFRTWLQRIKVNHCLNHLRKTRGAVMVDLDAAATQAHEAMRTAPDAERATQSATDRERIVAILDTMADTLRIPLLLRDADGQSYDEIATALGLSLSAVKMRIKRARQEFRRRFDEASSPAVGSRDMLGTL